MNLFQKNPTVVEAMQHIAPDAFGDGGNRRDIKQWGAPIMRGLRWREGEHTLTLAVLGGVVTLQPGDWIVKVGDGQYEGWAADDFEEKFQRADAEVRTHDAVEVQRLTSDVETLVGELEVAHAEIASLKTALAEATQRVLDEAPAAPARPTLGDVKKETKQS